MRHWLTRTGAQRTYGVVLESVNRITDAARRKK